MNTTMRFLLGLLAVFGLLAVSCGSDDETTGGGGSSDVSCDLGDLELATTDTLTVATGDPAFPPWIGVGDDNFDSPESQTGFEGGLVYAIAANMGFSDDQVVWVRTGFDEAIAPGSKDWDFNIQQYSITDAREEVVDFSDPYYATRQALVTFPDSPYAGAASIDDLKDATLGAAIGTTSLDFIADVIQPDNDPNVYDENVDLEAAMRAGQIDGLVVDVPTAYFVTAVQVEGSIIVGQFEAEAAAPDQFGLLFSDGNSLVSCVNQALGELKDDGTMQSLEDEWLTQDGGIRIIAG
ncbi:MAG: ABC transporter substrate-binding protein [Acidimicrobiales bacterium]